MAKEEEVKVEVPAAPAILPDGLQKKWVKDYTSALTQAQSDYPGDVSSQNQAALREANRVLRVPVLEDYEDAMSLKPWQFLKREQRGAELFVVTIEGKKFSFPVPTGGDNTRGMGEQKPEA